MRSHRWQGSRQTGPEALRVQGFRGQADPQGGRALAPPRNGGTDRAYSPSRECVALASAIRHCAWWTRDIRATSLRIDAEGVVDTDRGYLTRLSCRHRKRERSFIPENLGRSQPAGAARRVDRGQEADKNGHGRHPDTIPNLGLKRHVAE